MAQIEDIEAGLKAELNAGQTDPSRLRALAALMDGIRGDIYAAEASNARPPDASLADLAKDNAELKAAIAAGDMNRIRALSASIDGRVPLALREEAVAQAARVSPAHDEAERVAVATRDGQPERDEAARVAATQTASQPVGAGQRMPTERTTPADAPTASDDTARAARDEAERVAVATRDGHLLIGTPKPARGPVKP